MEFNTVTIIFTVLAILSAILALVIFYRNSVVKEYKTRKKTKVLVGTVSLNASAGRPSTGTSGQGGDGFSSGLSGSDSTNPSGSIFHSFNDNCV